MEKDTHTHTHTQQESRLTNNASESCVDYFSVSNRVVVITGSNRGNGFAKYVWALNICLFSYIIT
jgi:hypothetical protein